MHPRKEIWARASVKRGPGPVEAAALALRTEDIHIAGLGPRPERQPQTTPGGWAVKIKSQNPPGWIEERS